MCALKTIEHSKKKTKPAARVQNLSDTMWVIFWNSEPFQDSEKNLLYMSAHNSYARHTNHKIISMLEKCLGGPTITCAHGWLSTIITHCRCRGCSITMQLFPRVIPVFHYKCCISNDRGEENRLPKEWFLCVFDNGNLDWCDEYNNTVSFGIY